MAVVGIDLGTTNTVVGVARDGHVTAIRDTEGEYLIPSVVSFHPSGSILVGRSAKDRRVIDASNTIYSIKRLIGRSWNSEEVSHARARFPFEMREGPGQAALVVARGETFTLPEISAFVLRHAKALAEKALGEPVDRAVITVPANFNDLQRAATKVAGRVAGLDVLRILNEPTAAALAYGYGKGKGERVAIYDFGGGTFDVTILDLSGNVFEVLATAGNTFLGGDDIDIAIAERMARACLERYRVDARSDAQVFERLRYYAERLKVELSTSAEASVDIPEIGHDVGGRAINLSYRMTATELNAIAGPIVERTFEVCREAMQIARIDPKDVHQVVLVGGCTRIPLVRDRVGEYFGQPPLNRMNPDEVVAIGAAIQANALTGQERRRSVIPQPPMPASRGSSRPPGQIRKTDPFGMPARPSSSRPPRASPSSKPPAAEERRRVITGMGLGPALRGSKPPPLPARKPAIGKKGGTLDGLGAPVLDEPMSSETELPTFPSSPPSRGEGTRARAASSHPPRSSRESSPELPTARGSGPPLSDDFDPPTPVSPFFPDDETTKVGTARELFFAAEKSRREPARPLSPYAADIEEVTPLDPQPTDIDLRATAPFPTSGLAASTAGAPDRNPGERPIPKRQFARTMLGGTGSPKPPPPSRGSGTSSPSMPAAPSATASPRAQVPIAAPMAGVAASIATVVAEPHAAFATIPDDADFAASSGSSKSFTAAKPESRRLDISEPPRGERPPLPLLVDVTPLSLCVETVSGFRDVIISRNTPVPCEQSHTFVTAVAEQETALVRVGQGESARFDENTLLGEVELSGLRKAPRGEVHIVVTFSLDTDGMLDVRAADAETGHASTARLRLLGLPDADEVGRMTARHLAQQAR